tara:strand:- start:234 stop:503 length:270 start_codon:yes stop_codon:yes gene_type:complete
MARLLVKGAETSITAGQPNATNCGTATCVRLWNNPDNGVIVVYTQTAGGVAIGSFSMTSGSVEIIEKNATDEVYSTGGALKFTKLGFTN